MARGTTGQNTTVVLHWRVAPYDIPLTMIPWLFLSYFSSICLVGARTIKPSKPRFRNAHRFICCCPIFPGVISTFPTSLAVSNALDQRPRKNANRLSVA
ncbi:hypothetical protein EDD16DRAFT_1582706 [Pisolithus croceorrhizus]|nr:hypothetical protein EDD16DRAFT_1582706 [Pisolithus croceorrhizus]